MRFGANIPVCVHNLTQAGIAFDDAMALRRISMTLHAWHELECGTSNDHNSYSLVRGIVEKDIRDFRYVLMQRLEADGWTMSYDGGNHMKVRPPGHRKPFQRRCKVEA